MSAGSTLAAGRRALTAQMTDQCVIRRQTGKVLDPDSDLYVPTYDTVYTGPCRLKFAATRVESRELAEQILVAQLMTLSLPYDAAAGVRVDDIAEISTQPTPVVVDGQPTTRPLQVRISGVFAQTFATGRRFPAEVIT